LLQKTALAQKNSLTKNSKQRTEKNFDTVKKYIDFTENINNGLRSIPDY
jgi:hypothetical protein